MNKDEAILKEYLPEDAIRPILYFKAKYQFDLKIAGIRKSKTGDYRPPQRGKGHRISINKGLNQYEFLITLIHEIAHLITWEAYKNRVPPHGSQWKKNYRELLAYFSRLKVFPEKIEDYINRTESFSASSCSDLALARLLREYDDEKVTFLEELPEGAYFSAMKGRIFRKEKLRRTRFICTEVNSGRKYLFSKVARVQTLTS